MMQLKEVPCRKEIFLKEKQYFRKLPEWNFYQRFFNITLHNSVGEWFDCDYEHVSLDLKSVVKRSCKLRAFGFHHPMKHFILIRNNKIERFLNEINLDKCQRIAQGN
jgi:hypothetical protein